MTTTQNCGNCARYFPDEETRCWHVVGFFEGYGTPLEHIRPPEPTDYCASHTTAISETEQDDCVQKNIAAMKANIAQQAAALKRQNRQRDKLQRETIQAERVMRATILRMQTRKQGGRA